MVIDQTLAFVGGIDLCYGRWDTHEYLLNDDYPPPPVVGSEEVYPNSELVLPEMNMHNIELVIITVIVYKLFSVRCYRLRVYPVHFYKQLSLMV